MLISFVLMVSAGILHSDTIPIVDDQYSIQSWLTDDGLPRNSVTSIAQSPNGFIWLGTRFSLIRFDGIEFKEYGLGPEDRIEDVRFVTSNDLNELYLAMGNQVLKKFVNDSYSNLSTVEDSHFDFHCVTTGPDNTVWAIDGEGVIYKVIGNELVKMAVLDADFQHDVLFNLNIAQDGTIWFSRGEFYGYFRPGQDTRIWRFNNEFIRLSTSIDGSVWILTSHELRQLIDYESGETKRVVALPSTNGWGSQVMADSRNRIWICSRDNGLFLWEKNELKMFSTVPKRFWSIFEDRDGSIWISIGGGGIYQIRDKLFQIIGNSTNPANSHTTSVSGSFVVPSSFGVCKLTGGNHFELIPAAPNLPISTVWSESDDRFWIGSQNGRLYHFWEGQIKEYRIDSSNQPIRLLFMDSKKTLWVGGFDWGLGKLPYPYDSIQRILSDDEHRQFFKAMAELPSGEIYAGARNGNIYRIDGENIQKFSRESGLNGSSILSMLYTSTGHLLAGTSGHGIAVLDGDKFRHISTEQGLYDPVVSQMVEDTFGYLWIGSTMGIFRIELSDVGAWLNHEKQSVTSMVYGKTHGLSNLEIISDYQPGASLTNDGIVQFATNKGVVRVDPEDIESSYSQPNAVIDSVHIDDILLPGNNPIRVRSGFQRISFNYTAASFASPKSIQYRCSLEGFDDDWIRVGKERSIRYVRLPPGNYTFKISASDQNGEWSSRYASIPIFVVPRWWETTFARGSFLILFTLSIGFIVRMIMIRRMQMAIERTRQEMMLERERTRISKDLHDDLGARLTEIAFMADLAPKDPADAATDESAWSSIARRARKAVVSLDETVWMIDPGKDALEQFVTYVVQYSTEFCGRSDLACRFNIPESLPSVKLEGRTRHHLFLAFKEALNNVVRHAEATVVNIRICCDFNVLQISVADNGKGLNLEEAESGQRHGISNMRDRLKRLGGEFGIQSSPENGTIITFTLTFKDK